MTSSKHLFTLGAAAMIACGLAATQVRGGLIVDRGLPNTNLNSDVGGDRSNVAWGFEGNYLSGDDFSLSALDPGMAAWRIDKLSVWTIVGAGEFTLGNRFKSISLFLGSDPDNIPSVMSAELTGNSTNNANVSVSDVSYPDTSEIYEGSGGSDLRIWQIDFENLGNFAPGEYLFALGGSGAEDDEDTVTFSHASNASLSGTTQDGADDLYRWFGGNALDSSITVGNFIDSDGNGWDKSSDINVQVFGRQVVPEPGSLTIMAFAGVGLLAFRRRLRGSV